MSGEQPTGQETPGAAEVQNTELASANAGTEANGLENAGGETQTPKEPKTYTEEEVRDQLERATAKAAAKAERRALRDARDLMMRLTPQQPVQQQSDGRPTRDQFQSEEGYFDALTDWKLDQRENAQKAAKHQEQSKSLMDRTKKIYADAEKIPGFDRDDFDSLPLTKTIAESITESDIAPKLMAYMTQNPGEVDRIRALSSARQAAEIGKLEVKLTTAAKAPKAPPPIEAVNGGGGSQVKSLANMTPQEYEAFRMKQSQRPAWAR